jgi:hypothetical protein
MPKRLVALLMFWTRPVEKWTMFPVLVGFLVYAYVTHFYGLNPFKVDWLLPFWRGNIDSSQHYIGWEFFRQAPLLQWPPGKSPNLGPTGGSGIALTDSLPLFAFLFKPLLHRTSRPFQYFGIWILTCFVLQAVFAWKLITIWIKKWEQALLAVLFICFMPMFLDRMTWHFALAGHWLLLAGLFLMVTENFSFRKWLTLGISATLIQPYLAIMVSILYLLTLLARGIRVKQVTWIAFRTTTLGAVIFATGWLSGLFQFGLGAAGSSGFGMYSANILTWVDPGFTWANRFTWSRVVPDQWQGDGQYEGFGFLGAGVLLMAFVVWVVLIFRSTWLRRVLLVVPPVAAPVLWGHTGATQFKLCALFGVLIGVILVAVHSQLAVAKSRTYVYVCGLGFLSLGAISNVVFIGDVSIGSFPIPSLLEQLFSIVRTSGRLLWPVTYLLVCIIIVSLSRNLRRYIATAVLLFAFSFQIHDSRDAIAITRESFNRGSAPEFLVSPLWETLGSRYSKVAILLPNDAPMLYPTNPDWCAPDYSYIWRDFGLFAIKHKMQLNSFYFSRAPTNQLESGNKILKASIMGRSLDSDTLYVFIDSALWNFSKAHNHQDDLLGILDNMPILAPNLLPCIKCNMAGFQNYSQVQK